MHANIATVAHPASEVRLTDFIHVRSDVVGEGGQRCNGISLAPADLQAEPRHTQGRAGAHDGEQHIDPLGHRFAAAEAVDDAILRAARAAAAAAVRSGGLESYE